MVANADHVRNSTGYREDLVKELVPFGRVAHSITGEEGKEGEGGRWRGGGGEERRRRKGGERGGEEGGGEEGRGRRGGEGEEEKSGTQKWQKRNIIVKMTNSLNMGRRAL